MNLDLKACLNFHICFAISVLWSFSSQKEFTGSRVRGGLRRWIYSPDEISGKAPCDSIRARTPPKGLCLSRLFLTSQKLLEISNEENWWALGFFCSQPSSDQYVSRPRTCEDNSLLLAALSHHAKTGFPASCFVVSTHHTESTSAKGFLHSSMWLCESALSRWKLSFSQIQALLGSSLLSGNCRAIPCRQKE